MQRIVCGSSESQVLQFNLLRLKWTIVFNCSNKGLAMISSTERTKQWRKDNPEKARAIYARQAARRREASNKKGPRQFSGNFPDLSEWRQIAEPIVFESRSWFLFLKPTETDWINVKVCCDGKATRKANYWISWNGERFSKSKDYIAMLEHRADLLGLIEQALKND